MAHMKPGGAIVNTASVSSDLLNPMLLAYATTRGAIQNFTGGLAQMLAPKAFEPTRHACRPDVDVHVGDDGRGCRRQTVHLIGACDLGGRTAF